MAEPGESLLGVFWTITIGKKLLEVMAGQAREGQDERKGKDKRDKFQYSTKVLTKEEIDSQGKAGRRR